MSRFDHLLLTFIRIQTFLNVTYEDKIGRTTLISVLSFFHIQVLLYSDWIQNKTLLKVDLVK